MKTSKIKLLALVCALGLAPATNSLRAAAAAEVNSDIQSSGAVTVSNGDQTTVENTTRADATVTVDLGGSNKPETPSAPEKPEPTQPPPTPPAKPEQPEKPEQPARPERPSPGLKISAEVHKALEAMKQSRDAYLRSQADLRLKLKTASDEERTAIRAEIREKREAFLEAQKQAREESRQQIAQIKASLKEHAEVLSDARAEAKAEMKAEAKARLQGRRGGE